MTDEELIAALRRRAREIEHYTPTYGVNEPAEELKVAADRLQSLTGNARVGVTDEVADLIIDHFASVALGRADEIEGRRDYVEGRSDAAAAIRSESSNIAQTLPFWTTDLPAALPSGVRVKPLEWTSPKEGWLEATTPWGTFLICGQPMFGKPWRSFSPMGWPTYSGEDAEEVRQKIEVDYERRILSAIEPTPSPSHAETVAPYAAALRMIRDAVGELFGPVSDLESEEAVLLRGPEPHHEAEAIIMGLQRVKRETERLLTLNADLEMQARGHAQEARTANATIYEIYQVLSGGKGEPGNWNGAEPARQYVHAAEARVAELEKAVKGLLECPDVADNDHKDEETHAAERAARAALQEEEGGENG